MPRYIDADELIKKIFPYDVVDRSRYTINAKAVYEAIQKAPTADLVEVVRCKACKNWEDTSFDTVTEEHWGECRKPLGDYRYCETAENDFCSYGERKE